jgi:hypothetical protein
MRSEKDMMSAPGRKAPRRKEPIKARDSIGSGYGRAGADPLEGVYPKIPSVNMGF